MKECEVEEQSGSLTTDIIELGDLDDDVLFLASPETLQDLIKLSSGKITQEQIV